MVGDKDAAKIQHQTDIGDGVSGGLKHESDGVERLGGGDSRRSIAIDITSAKFIREIIDTAATDEQIQTICSKNRIEVISCDGMENQSLKLSGMLVQNKDELDVTDMLKTSGGKINMEYAQHQALNRFIGGGETEECANSNSATRDCSTDPQENLFREGNSIDNSDDYANACISASETISIGESLSWKDQILRKYHANNTTS